MRWWPAWGRIAPILLTGLLAASMPVRAQAQVPAGPAEEITALAEGSSCAAVRWGRQGRAPPGYIPGMALVFARSLCRADQPDIQVVGVAPGLPLRKPGDAPSSDHADALAAYEPQFRAARMSAIGGTRDTLRSVYVMLIGLGMRESTGRFCVGRAGAGTKTDGKTVEAGLFQTTFGTSQSHPMLPTLFARYDKDGSRCLRDVFERGVACSSRDAQDWGDGDGARWQHLTKTCPAFAVEHAAIVLRTVGGTKGAFGPIVKKSVSLRPECDALLSRVQERVVERARGDPAYCEALGGD